MMSICSSIGSLLQALPVLQAAGNAKHDNAADHAEEQYLFVEDKRRKVSDQNAENQFLSDLHSTVKTVAAKRRKNRL
jgi:hypothetical protein